MKHFPIIVSNVIMLGVITMSIISHDWLILTYQIIFVILITFNYVRFYQVVQYVKLLEKTLDKEKELIKIQDEQIKLQDELIKAYKQKDNNHAHPS